HPMGEGGLMTTACFSPRFGGRRSQIKCWWSLRDTRVPAWLRKTFPSLKSLIAPARPFLKGPLVFVAVAPVTCALGAHLFHLFHSGFRTPRSAFLPCAALQLMQ